MLYLHFKTQSRKLSFAIVPTIYSHVEVFAVLVSKPYFHYALQILQMNEHKVVAGL